MPLKYTKGEVVLLTDFKIKNFKAFDDFNLQNLKKVNIFVGKPNTGKTSILEALSLFLAKNPYMLVLLLSERNILNDEDCFQSLFFDYKTNNYISLISNNDTVAIRIKDDEKSIVAFTDNDFVADRVANGLEFKIKQNSKNTQFDDAGYISFYNEQNSLKLKYKRENEIDSLNKLEFIFNFKNKRYQDRFIKDISSILQAKDQEKMLQKKMQHFSSNIDGLKFLNNNKLVVRQKKLQHDIDFRLLGQGFQTYIFILVAILAGKKYILIDEIENGLHFESIDLLLESILNSPKDTQFFITTHNEEILQRLASKIGEKNKKTEDIAVFNIYHNKEQKLEAVQYSQENFIHAMSYGNEVRE